MIKTKVNAFTLVEVLVSLVLTAIILSIIFVIFSIMTERMADYKLQNEPVSEMNRFMYVVNKDIFESTDMRINDQVLVFTSYSGRTSRFVHSNGYIIRHGQSFVDTFRISVSTFRIDTVTSGPKTVFKKLNFRSKINDNDTDLKVYMRIDAAQLVNAQL